jgi:hypothetical protein
MDDILKIALGVFVGIWAVILTPITILVLLWWWLIG